MSWWPRPGIARIQKARDMRHDTAAYLRPKGKAKLYPREHDVRLVLLADFLRNERTICQTMAEREVIDDVMGDEAKKEAIL